MGERVALPVSVRGDLDTANPITDRDPGTLVEAIDLHPRYWGPRVGSKAFTRATEGPGTASLYDEITLDGTDVYGAGFSQEDQARDLGTEFTLDLWARLTDTSFASGKTGIGLYMFSVNAAGFVDLSVYGPASANAGKIKVTITTTPTRSSAASAVTFDSATAFVAGSSQQHKYHIRLVRSGANATLYLNGQSDGSTSSLSATNPIFSSVDTTATVGLGYSNYIADTTVTFKGQIFGAVLRDGLYTASPIEAVMPADPWARNVHHYYIGRNYALGGSDHFFDASRFGMHARIVGTGATTSAANDEAAPAPAAVQGVRTWTTRTNRTATAVVSGGVLSHATIS